MISHDLPWQELDFFHCVKVGDITSRLSADCERIESQVTYNLNIFLRSLIQVTPSDAFRCLRMPSDAFRCLQMPSDAFRCLPMPSDAFRAL